MSQTNSVPAAQSNFINRSTAIEMTGTYREQSQNILAANYQNSGILPLSETFHRSAIDALLAQENCAGLRVYYGMDGDLKVHAVLVGVDENNADILAGVNSLTESEDDEDVIVELGQRCPDLCPPPSPLNS